MAVPPAWVYAAAGGGATYWLTLDGGNNVAIPAAATVMGTVQAMIVSIKDRPRDVAATGGRGHQQENP